MARIRDQFTGHVWLCKLNVDLEMGQADVWDVSALGDNLVWLVTAGLIVVSEKREGMYNVRCVPHKKVSLPHWASHAAAYRGCDLAGLMQAAVNDYNHLACQTALPTFDQTMRVRRVNHRVGGDPCLAVK